MTLTLIPSVLSSTVMTDKFFFNFLMMTDNLLNEFLKRDLHYT